MIQSYIFDYDTKNIEDIEYTEELIRPFINPNFYDTCEFHSYHQKFTEKVCRLFIRSNEKFIGYCYMGFKDNLLKAPYSSPFSMIFLKPEYKMTDVCIFTESLKNFADKLGVRKIQFTLPPEIYSLELINSFSASFSSEGFRVKQVDLNNYYDIKKYIDRDSYLKNAAHKVRKNYKTAVRNNISFLELPIDDFRIAYEVIRINRQQMGYPLKISEQQMDDLIKMESLKVRSFVAKKEDIPVAAAIVFDVTEDVSQVVYWGDDAGYRDERPMDLLTTEIFGVYKELGKRYLDIGPSSDAGIINAGLADFKKSIGCDNCIKLTFEYELK